MRLERFWILGALIIVAGCLVDAQSPIGAQSGIEGIITISPAKPGPVRVGEAGSVPVKKTTFTVENNKGEVASFTTGQDGRFQALLPPGHYKISLKGKRLGMGHFGPFEVDVAPAKMTSVQWECDSGIR